MHVLIACEVSGVVRDAFIALGNDAWSCDLLPTEHPGPHFQADVISILNQDWDLMIAHPPCQHLAVSGARWFQKKQVEQRKAIWFFLKLAQASIPKICIENPVCIMSGLYRKPDQIIQPFQFGHPESKKTCLWLKGLPLLAPTDILPLPKCGYWQNQTPSRQNKIGPSPQRAALRARTYPGIAKAMAEQWGSL